MKKMKKLELYEVYQGEYFGAYYNKHKQWSFKTDTIVTFLCLETTPSMEFSKPIKFFKVFNLNIFEVEYYTESNIEYAAKIS